MKKSVVLEPHLRLNNVNVENIVDRVIEENEKILQGLNENIGRRRRRKAAKPTTTSEEAAETSSDMLPEHNVPRKGTKRTLFDVDNVCRTCLSTGQLKSLYQEQPLGSRIHEMLMVCTSIKVHVTDGLPLNICTNCITELNRSYSFVLKCRQSDAKLRIANHTIQNKQDNMNQTTKSRDPEFVPIKHFPNLNHEPNEIAIDPLEIHMNIVKDEMKAVKPIADTYLKVKKVATINEDCDDPDYVKTMPPLIDMGQQEAFNIFEFQCYVCHERFPSFDRLEKHHKEMHKTKVFDKDKLHRCTICCETFKYNYMLKDHMQCHTGRVNTCQLCRCTFAHESDLWTHRRVQHQIYTCRICNVIFERLINLQKHLKSIHDLVECGSCQKVFNEQIFLTDHFHAFHATSVCPICGQQFRFASEADASEHMISHTIEKTFPCKICDRSFIEQHYLDEHMKTHKSKEIYSCPACLYNTCKQINLSKHMFVHKGDTFLLCTVCDHPFAEWPNLTEHMRTHAGEVYSCTICDTSYAKKDYLHRHMHKHTDREHFSCPVCHKLFNSPSSIEAHMSKHAQDHSFSCVICKDTFCCIADFMIHIHKYPAPMQYMCTICKIMNKKTELSTTLIN